MSDKTQTILDAANAMFARYGYAKTTIGDIVSEAGVARQTLYNTFESKEEILRSVVQRSGDEMTAAYTAAWESLDTVEAKLESYHDLVICNLFLTIQATPDWESLVAGLYQSAANEMIQQDIGWRKSLLDLFTQTLRSTNSTSLPAEDVVEFFQSSSMNAKYGVVDFDHLKFRLNLIRTATVALLKK